jgi:hypothetical protein
MSLMLRNFEYLAGGTAGGQYPSADLEANIAAATTGAALRTALGIGAYVDDAAAGVGGVSSGALYYNTTDSEYVLKS